MAIPANLVYTKEHEWVTIEGNIATIGITDHAQSELGEIVYVEVDTVGETIGQGEVFGTIEAVKTTSDLFMPLTGEVIEFNPELDESKEDNPAAVNESPYDKGWIIKVAMSDASQVDDLLTADTYESLIK